jgi:prepilin signal peptidase PulO-like enzyme (type II secretory pathway)
MHVLIGIYIAVIGAIVGSFINALVWRMHQQLDDEGNPKKLSKKKLNELSIIKGRSMCPHCKTQLVAKDLVPIISWLTLGGKCRYCSKPISKEYPAVELMTAVLFAFSYFYWPFELVGIEWIVFAAWMFALVMLIALAVYDAKWYILPSKLIYLGVVVYGLSLVLYSVLSGSFDRLGWAFLSAFVYYVLFISIYVASLFANKKGLSSKEWLGFGDVRLAFLLGLIVGTPAAVFVALFLGSIIGLIVAAPSLAQQKTSMTAQIPFGPYLIAGAYFALLFSDQLVSWYTSSILGI